jgi:cation:H+ antiporter
MSGTLLDRAIASSMTGAKWLESLWQWLSTVDPWGPLGIFILSSMLMVYRLNAMEKKGLEGTVLGTLVMPYASGFPNLAFALSLGRQGGSGSIIIENCLVNNVTNLTLLIGLPALLWKLGITPCKPTRTVSKTATRNRRLNTLSLSLSLMAMFFFTGVLWALGKDGRLDFGDGLVLVGMFIFWQAFHVFDVLKYTLLKRSKLPRTLFFDALLVVLLGVCVVHGVDRLVAWAVSLGPGFFLYDQLGFISGCLMVLPNGVLAAYYARAGRGDIVYSSQVGDGHVCIPLCIGLFSLFSVISVPPCMNTGILVLLGAGLLHFFFLLFAGRLPRFIGALLVLVYGFFLAFFNAAL